MSHGTEVLLGLFAIFVGASEFIFHARLCMNSGCMSKEKQSVVISTDNQILSVWNGTGPF